MSDEPLICPVCGSPIQPLPPGPAQCSSCSFSYAGVRYFSGKDSLALWNRLVQSAQTKLRRSMQAVCAQPGRFTVCGGAAVWRSHESGRLILVSGNSSRCLDLQVQQYSASETAGHNSAMLMRDGTVKSTGDNEYGQCATSGLKGIRRILATASCTYAITGEGGVAYCGQPVSASITQWHNVKDLACGTYHIAGLTSDGRVLLAGEMLNARFISEVSQWRDIVSIASSEDSLLGLRKDGTAVFAGAPGDPRAAAVRAWTDITAIALESIYAVGLTASGSVMIAGENANDFLDMGRKSAADWKDIVSIAATRSGICGLDAGGSLHMVGNIRDAKRTQASWNRNRDTVREELCKAAGALGQAL